MTKRDVKKNKNKSADVYQSLYVRRNSHEPLNRSKIIINCIICSCDVGVHYYIAIIIRRYFLCITLVTDEIFS